MIVPDGAIIDVHVEIREDLHHSPGRKILTYRKDLMGDLMIDSFEPKGNFGLRLIYRGWCLLDAQYMFRDLTPKIVRDFIQAFWATLRDKYDGYSFDFKDGIFWFSRPVEVESVTPVSRPLRKPPKYLAGVLRELKYRD